MASEAEQKKYPITPEGVLCWIEIPARDLQKLQPSSPNWKWRENQSSPDTVISFDVSEHQSGGLVKMPEGVPQATEQIMGSGMTAYFFVDSIEEATERIAKLGGKTVLPKRPEGQNGWFSNLVGNEGNRFGIYEMRKELIEEK